MALVHASSVKTLVVLAMISSARAAMMCDEAQCTSPSMYKLAFELMGQPELAKQNGLYDCWANGKDEPYSCVSGYTGQVVPTVPELGDYKYYTCCKTGFTAADVVQDCDTSTFPDGPKAGSCTSPADDKGVNKDCITCGEQRTCTGLSGGFSNPRSMSASFKAPGISGSCTAYLCCKTANGITLSFNLWLYLLTFVAIVVVAI